ncbi:hypothetical protein E4O93_07610 [Diaphorobacter sp. DS2]|nr:hypothetical protein E4O93_07610 [Diaphorobacter sp. DS2]
MSEQPSPPLNPTAERQRQDVEPARPQSPCPPPSYDAELRAIWRARPWRYKALHRWNVIKAFLCRDIHRHSLMLGLLEPHAVQHLALRPGHRLRGMLVVCPELTRELDRMNASEFDSPRGPIA